MSKLLMRKFLELDTYLGVLLALFFGVRFMSICVRLAAEPRNPLLLGALSLDAGSAWYSL
jgi:hypothetical protein